MSVLNNTLEDKLFSFLINNFQQHDIGTIKKYRLLSLGGDSMYTNSTKKLKHDNKRIPALLVKQNDYNVVIAIKYNKL